MPSADQSERLAAELKVMRALAAESSVLEFEASGDPPKEYKVTLRGKGITRGSPFGGDVECSELHEFHIYLGYAYPEHAPEVRWVTPVFHPNVSSIGYIRLEECGLAWERELTLDVVCERLWDVVRGAYLDLDKATNFSAKSWFAEQTEIMLPVDRRPLRDRGGAPPGNIIRYERGRAGAQPTSDDVLFIGDDTPTPPIPPRHRDDDILYIGDE